MGVVHPPLHPSEDPTMELDVVAQLVRVRVAVLLVDRQGVT
jgi:hypothetical protein